MPAKTETDDAVSAHAANALALAEEKKLNRYLDMVLKAEDLRSEANALIRSVWNQVEAEGFDLAAARRQLVLRAIVKA